MPIVGMFVREIGFTGAYDTASSNSVWFNFPANFTVAELAMISVFTNDHFMGPPKDPLTARGVTGTITEVDSNFLKKEWGAPTGAWEKCTRIAVKVSKHAWSTGSFRLVIYLWG